MLDGNASSNANDRSAWKVMRFPVSPAVTDEESIAIAANTVTHSSGVSAL